jgi:hypothetical protein
MFATMGGKKGQPSCLLKVPIVLVNNGPENGIEHIRFRVGPRAIVWPLELHLHISHAVDALQNLLYE